MRRVTQVRNVDGSPYLPGRVCVCHASLSQNQVMSQRTDKDEKNGGGAMIGVAVAGLAVAGLAYLFWPEPEPVVVRPAPGPGPGPAPRAQDIRQLLRAWAAENRDKRTPVEENVPEALMCKICTFRRFSYSFGCGHATCVECAVQLCERFESCPFDKTKFTAVPKRLFL